MALSASVPGGRGGVGVSVVVFGRVRGTMLGRGMGRLLSTVPFFFVSRAMSGRWVGRLVVMMPPFPSLRRMV